mgnify:CR=1 FL=1
MIINLAKLTYAIRKCSKSISCLVRDKIFLALVITGFLFVLPLAVSHAVVLNNPIGINTFQDLVNILGKYIFNLAIPVAVIVIIYAGILMLTAGGNPGKFKKGAQALIHYNYMVITK